MDLQFIKANRFYQFMLHNLLLLPVTIRGKDQEKQVIIKKYILVYWKFLFYFCLKSSCLALFSTSSYSLN